MADFRKNYNYNWNDVVDPMTDDEVRKWVAALRSGEYAQSKGKLKTPKGFCCLGVEREIHPTQCEQVESNVMLVSSDHCPVRLPDSLQDELAEKNDLGVSFQGIADMIEKGFGLA